MTRIEALILGAQAVTLALTAAGAVQTVLLRRRLRTMETDQAWFWTPEWQAGEREADADLALGRFETFESGEDFLKSLMAEPSREAGTARVSA